MCSLAEKIATLTDPRPKSIDPEDFGQEDSAAALCDFPNEESDSPKFKQTRSSLRARLRNAQLEEDPRYGGRSVSRREVEEEWGDGEGLCNTVKKMSKKVR